MTVIVVIEVHQHRRSGSTARLCVVIQVQDANWASSASKWVVYSDWLLRSLKYLHCVSDTSSVASQAVSGFGARIPGTAQRFRDSVLGF